MFNNFKRKRIANLENQNLENTSTKPVKNIIFRLFKLSIWIILIILFLTYNSYNNFKEEILVSQKTFIEINSWDNYYYIAEKLNINSRFLKTYIKNNNPDYNLMAWNFYIRENAKVSDILEDLQKPIILDQIDITILEWWNIYDIDYYLTNKKLINKGEYINYVTSNEKIEALKEYFPFIEWLETLEWFLYPDTYTVNSNPFKINQFVIKQLENFEIKVYNKILKNLSNKEIEDLVNLSSIVEKEERNSNEKATVAWILKKRLDNWWMIWADITVCYPYKLTSEECKMVVTKYLNIKTDYNTRQMRWLPKTPIWNPTYETINATLNYKETNYWFYLHDTVTGKIYYAETNEWHEQNKRLYLR